MNESFSLTKLILIYVIFFASSFVYLLCFVFLPEIKLTNGENGLTHCYVFVLLYSVSKLIPLYVYFFSISINNSKPIGSEDGEIQLSPLFPTDINENDDSCANWNKTSYLLSADSINIIDRKPKIVPFYMYTVYALIDVVSRLCLIVGMSFYPKIDVNSSIYPIVFIVFATYLVTLFNYKKEFINKNVSLGFIFYFFGIGFVCVGDLVKKILFNTYSEDETNQIITGVIIVLIGEVLKLILYLIHQHNITFNKVAPNLQIGLEGFFGSIYMVILILILQFTRCPFKESKIETDFDKIFLSLCKDSVNFEDMTSFLSAFSNSLFLFLIIVFFISCSLFNLFGAYVIKTTNALFLMMTENCKIIPLGIILGFISDTENQNYYFFSLVGFMFMVLGCTMYLKIVRCSCLEKKYHKKNFHRKINLY